MQTFTPISETHRACRLAAQKLLNAVDDAYAALPDDAVPDLARADAIDSKFAEGEHKIWARIEGDALGLTLFEDLARHLRNGDDVRYTEHEPALAEAARMIRAARMHGAVDQTRVDAVASDLESFVKTGRAAFGALAEDVKRLCLARDLAQSNQRGNWLRRVARANPDADLSGLIRECERKSAAAKFAYATAHSKGAK